MHLKSSIQNLVSLKSFLHVSNLQEALLLPDDSADILFRLQQRELLQQLLEAFLAIPIDCRKVCWLHYEKGLNKKEIANLLNISLSTAQHRLSWGLYLLKTQIAKKPKNPV